MEYMIQMKRDGKWVDGRVYSEYEEAYQAHQELEDIAKKNGFDLAYRVVCVPEASLWTSEEVINRAG